MKLHEMILAWGKSDAKPPDIEQYIYDHARAVYRGWLELQGPVTLASNLTGMGVMLDIIHQFGIPDDLAELFQEPVKP